MKRVIVIFALMFALTARAADPMIDRDGWRRAVPPVTAEIEELYFSLSDLAVEDQREQIWGLSSHIKSALWKYNIERYLREHPELSAEAQELLREGTRLVTTPGWFDIVDGSFGYVPKSIAREELKSRAREVLPREAVFEIFIRLGPEPLAPEKPASDPRRVQTDGPFGGMCSCATDYDCAGGASGYRCFSAWCIDTTHCGFYGEELCTGKCKEIET